MRTFCFVTIPAPPIRPILLYTQHALFIILRGRWPIAENARKFNVSLGKLKLNLPKRNEFINIRVNIRGVCVCVQLPVLIESSAYSPI